MDRKTILQVGILKGSFIADKYWSWDFGIMGCQSPSRRGVLGLGYLASANITSGEKRSRVVKELNGGVQAWEFEPHKNHLGSQSAASLCPWARNFTLFVPCFKGTSSRRSCVHVFLAHSAQFQIADFSQFGSVRYGHGFINCLASESFVVSFS